MFQLDDKFLADIGLNDLPEDQKQPFLQHIYEELELRVGTRLSDGLSDDQLEQFEKIIDRDQATVDAWIQQYVPNYTQDQVFTRMQQATNLDPSDPNLKAEFVATKWLEVNRPDYRQVVAQVLDELKREIVSNRDTILGGDQQSAA
jgi:ferric iron reductase protein FhuF